MVDGSKLSHSSLSDSRKIDAALLDVICPRAVAGGDGPRAGLVGVWAQSFPPEGGEASLEVKDDLDSQRSVSSLIVLDPGEIFVMDERLDEDCPCDPKGGKAEN